MKKLIFSLAIIMAFPFANAQNAERRARLEKHLYYLASDSLHGREAGSEDGVKARAYILNEWNQIGIDPFLTEGYEMPFTKNGLNMANLIGIIPGNDPELKDEYILLGAHFDHIGYKNGEICNGADDNASGSTALIEIARILKENQSKLKRSVIIAAFDGEEKGLWGSQALADRMSQDGTIGSIKCMMSIDMVGWYAKNGQLEILGAGTIKDGKKLLNDNAGQLKLKIEDFETAILTATDTRSFAVKYNVPTLHMFTGLKSPYHKPADDADLIDYDGLEGITCFIARVTEQMASDPKFGGTGKIAAIHSGRVKPFELGVSAGFTVSNINFPDANLTATGRYGWLAGLTAQYNTKDIWAIRLGAFYETASSFFPDQTNMFGASLKYKQSAIEVPATLIMQNNDPTVRVYLGLGPTARYVFNSSLESLNYKTTQLQWGINLLIGMKIGHLYIEDYLFSNFNDMFDTPAGEPKARLNMTTFRIGWTF